MTVMKFRLISTSLFRSDDNRGDHMTVIKFRLIPLHYLGRMTIGEII